MPDVAWCWPRAQLLAGLLIQQYFVHRHRGSGAASGRGRYLVHCSVDPPQVVLRLTEDQVRAPVALAIDKQHHPLGRVARSLERSALSAAANAPANVCGEVVPVAVAALEPRDPYIHAAGSSPGRLGSVSNDSMGATAGGSSPHSSAFPVVTQLRLSMQMSKRRSVAVRLYRERPEAHGR